MTFFPQHKQVNSESKLSHLLNKHLKILTPPFCFTSISMSVKRTPGAFLWPFQMQKKMHTTPEQKISHCCSSYHHHHHQYHHSHTERRTGGKSSQLTKNKARGRRSCQQHSFSLLPSRVGSSCARAPRVLTAS